MGQYINTTYYAKCHSGHPGGKEVPKANPCVLVTCSQALRKEFSQEERAAQLNTKGPVIGRYERDEMKPSIEAATKLAQEGIVLNQSLIIFGDRLKM